MRWTPGDRSNIEDDRSSSGIGLTGGIPLGIGGFVLLLVLSWATGTNLFSLISPADQPSTATVGTTGRAASNPTEEREVDLVDAVMKDVQDSWRAIL